jgi:hypothetical protein
VGSGALVGMLWRIPFAVIAHMDNVLWGGIFDNAGVKSVPEPEAYDL